MKKIILLVFMAGMLSAQTWDFTKDGQDVIPQFDTWVLVNSDSSGNQKTQYLRNIIAGDTVWTEPFVTRSYMDLEAIIVDTAVTDSVILYAELWQGNLPDSSDFVKVKDLTFNNQAGTIREQDSISTAGVWNNDLNTSTFRCKPYSRVLIRTGVKHSISNGVHGKFEFSAPPGSETGVFH
jgi:hypothetical protein